MVENLLLYIAEKIKYLLVNDKSNNYSGLILTDSYGPLSIFTSLENFKIMKALLIAGTALAGTLYTIYITRKNLKTAKYIDTITAHRIKWIDIITNEVADISTNIHLSLNTMSQEIEAQTIENSSPSNDPECQSKQDWHLFSVYTSIAFMEDSIIPNCSDLIFKLNRLKLRINSSEDTEINTLIEDIIKFYTDGERKDEVDIQKIRKITSLLMVQFQIVFKNEWEKVKQESYGNIKGSRIKYLLNKLLLHKKRIFGIQHK